MQLQRSNIVRTVLVSITLSFFFGLAGVAQAQIVAFGASNVAGIGVFSQSGVASPNTQRIYRIAAGYLVSSCLILQIAAVLSSALSLPSWTLKALPRVRGQTS
jgi:hypothetical protein